MSLRIVCLDCETDFKFLNSPLMGSSYSERYQMIHSAIFQLGWLSTTPLLKDP